MQRSNAQPQHLSPHIVRRASLCINCICIPSLARQPSSNLHRILHRLFQYLTLLQSFTRGPDLFEAKRVPSNNLATFTCTLSTAHERTTRQIQPIHARAYPVSNTTISNSSSHVPPNPNPASPPHEALDLLPLRPHHAADPDAAHNNAYWQAPRPCLPAPGNPSANARHRRRLALPHTYLVVAEPSFCATWERWARGG